MCCVSCEVRTEFICYVEESRWVDCLDNVGSLTPHNPIGLQGLLRDSFTFTLLEESRPPLWSSGQSSWLQNGDVLCFLWGTNWIYICYVEECRLPLWSSGQSSWLHIQRSGFDSRHYQIFWAVVSLERDPLSLVSTTEELLERKSSGSGLEIREYGRRDPSPCPRGIFYPQKLALTSPKSGGLSIGTVCSWTSCSLSFMPFYQNSVCTPLPCDLHALPISVSYTWTS
jgi:hypothetical protein